MGWVRIVLPFSPHSDPLGQASSDLRHPVIFIVIHIYFLRERSQESAQPLFNQVSLLRANLYQEQQIEVGFNMHA